MARRVFAALALSVVVAACGSAPGAKEDSDKPAATPAASVDAKPDISKVGALVGFRPRTSLEEIIKSVIAYQRGERSPAGVSPAVAAEATPALGVNG